MSIESLSTEVMLMITSYLSTSDIASLMLTNRSFSIFLSREIFYSVIRPGNPRPCHQAIFEAAFRDDRELLKELIRRGILDITRRTYRPLIEQAIYELRSAETIGTLLYCLPEPSGIESAMELAQLLGMHDIVEVLFPYLE
ncbi:hypothetical protein HOY80DRAFT_1000463 [Tuber brumale]|nr:hypothetical protein HOY80DRAFT_1000463 [Tuber brumale]